MEVGEVIRIYLVDDHPVFRMGLAGLLRSEADITLVGECETGREALSDIPTKEIDIVVVDLALQDMSGLELIRELNREKRDFSILVLSMHDEDVFAERALKLGADGYLMKNTAPVDIIKAIRQIAREEVALSKRQSDLMLKRILGRGSKQGDSPLKLLSDRELEVFELVGHGKSTRNVAEKLFISVKTVETHQAHIKRKLGLSNHSELMRSAFAWVNEIRPSNVVDG